MKIILSLVLVTIACLVAWAGAAANLDFVLGVVIPYVAVAVFLGGLTYRVWKWARSPVPFHIPTTTGQQKSLDFIKQDKLESPYTKIEVIGRMALEILTFRSLFRNTSAELTDDKNLVYGSEKYLWAAGLAFHWSLLIILFRHLRFFLDPVPQYLNIVTAVDGFLQITLPTLYMTDLVIVAALTFLFLRRVALPQVRYISLTTDYFALFLLLAIASSGGLMRYFFKTDIVAVKQLAMGLATFNPTVPDGIGTIFWIHLFLVCLLLIYFPFSKLLHMAGVFMSPTRNLANNSRAVRHINPWNPEVKTHSYEEYEEEFYDLMKEAGFPMDKEKPEKTPQTEPASGKEE
ncbi:MAG: menaquinol oxidoreductase [Deltaproteobacteria bacterium]|nr:menaquinol oxidoreductase [Deltaproteobacteria bacterium]